MFTLFKFVTLACFPCENRSLFIPIFFEAFASAIASLNKGLYPFKYPILSLFWISFSIIPALSFSHGKSYSEKEIETALTVFEKAISLSPEFIEQTNTSTVTPFYKVNGHKVYLTDGFWGLTRAWLKIYIQELEKHCPCDLDPELMIQTAKTHAPSNLLKQTTNKTKRTSQRISYQASRLTAQYGYTAAVVKFSSEVAETILSVFMGLHGAHFWCNAIDLTIIPLARQFQKYIRVFSYAKNFSYSRLIFSLRMAWLSRQARKSQNKVFFIIETALDFNEKNLEKINHHGPKEHRHLWLNKLKNKTDPLFEKISSLEEEYYNLDNKLEGTDSVDKNKIKKRQRKLIKQIEKLKTKINNFSEVNRKSFFGNRFKRYLFLRSRKGQTAYMTGHHLSDKITGKKILWPLALQENILEPVLTHKNQSSSLKTEPDEIQKALVKEFLSKRQTDTQSAETNQQTTHSIKKVADKFSSKKQITSIKFSEGEQKVVYSLLESIEQVFNTTEKTQTRIMITSSIENVLTVLFGQYLQISLSILEQKYSLSYKELMKLHWIFGRFFHSVYEFSDFLNSVSIVKNKDKIKFYKYEAMEKLLAFLDYLYEIQILLTHTQIEKEEMFDTLQTKHQNLMSLSLLKDKTTAFSLIPFKKAQVKCGKLVEKH